jgi:hypothetical protein
MDNLNEAVERARREVDNNYGPANNTHTWQTEVRDRYETERTRAQKEASEKK